MTELCLISFLSIPAPSGAPTDVKNTKKEPTSLEITWKPPAVEHQNGIITNYTLKYREKGQRALFITVGGSKLSVVLHNLKKFTDYMVWVLASTVEGPGPYSERQTFKTAEGRESNSCFFICLFACFCVFVCLLDCFFALSSFLRDTFATF